MGKKERHATQDTKQRTHQDGQIPKSGQWVISGAQGGGKTRDQGEAPTGDFGWTQNLLFQRKESETNGTKC